MATPRLDHVNIQATRLDVTVAFYRDLLGLEPIDPPPPLDPTRVQWLRNDNGAAIFHISTAGALGASSRGEGTGPVHHIALDCADHDAMRARLEAMDHPHRLNHVAAIKLRQIFVHDPDGILLELNFRGS